jgi:hypothetical protein
MDEDGPHGAAGINPQNKPRSQHDEHARTHTHEAHVRNTPDLLTFLSSQGCLTDENVLELESEGLMDCSQVDPNPTGILFRRASIRLSAAIPLPLP